MFDVFIFYVVCILPALKVLQNIFSVKGPDTSSKLTAAAVKLYLVSGCSPRIVT